VLDNRALLWFTQSWIGASLAWHILKCLINGFSITTVPLYPQRVPHRLQSFECFIVRTYSSAFWAIKPTFGTDPIVVGSKAPFFYKSLLLLYKFQHKSGLELPQGILWFSSLFHICPDVRIIAGIEASTQYQKGHEGCNSFIWINHRKSGPFSIAWLMAASTSACSGRPAILAYTSPSCAYQL
jgi:hypothetical protein